MIPILIAVLCVLFLSVLIRRYHVQQERRDLLLMKRHAASYAELEKRC